MNRLALITGTGQGLGFALAEKHLSLGDEVYALTRRSTDQLTGLAKRSGKLHVHCCDIASTQSVQAAMAALLARGQRLDFLYNVAGLYGQQDRVPLADTDLDEGLHMLDVNGVGLLRVTKAALPLIGKGSLVVNITSEAGIITNCYRSYEYMYCVSKAAANMASKLRSNELHPLGARVICIHPGWLRTQIGGERAKGSPYAIEAAKSAEDIVGIATRIEEIPPSWLFMQHDGALLPW